MFDVSECSSLFFYIVADRYPVPRGTVPWPINIKINMTGTQKFIYIYRGTVPRGTGTRSNSIG